MSEVRTGKPARPAPDLLPGNICRLSSRGFHLAFLSELGLLSRQNVPWRVQ